MTHKEQEMPSHKKGRVVGNEYTTPRGLRNNNPLNIRHSADVFKGEIYGDDDDFKRFQALAYGYRAAFVILATYRTRGIDRMRKIISRWAPPSQNHTEWYIQTVERLSGVISKNSVAHTGRRWWRGIYSPRCRTSRCALVLCLGLN